MTLEQIKNQMGNLLDNSRSIINEGREPEVLEETLDILHDYELLSAQTKKDANHFHKEDRPVWHNGAWICPGCRRRVAVHHTYCHWCGKKMGWHK